MNFYGSVKSIVHDLFPPHLAISASTYSLLIFEEQFSTRDLKINLKCSDFSSNSVCLFSKESSSVLKVFKYPPRLQAGGVKSYRERRKGCHICFNNYFKDIL